eukprot:356864-Chlamydomonas_euryale.AAC.2
MVALPAATLTHLPCAALPRPDPPPPALQDRTAGGHANAPPAGAQRRRAGRFRRALPVARPSAHAAAGGATGPGHPVGAGGPASGARASALPAAQLAAARARDAAGVGRGPGGAAGPGGLLPAAPHAVFDDHSRQRHGLRIRGRRQRVGAAAGAPRA